MKTLLAACLLALVPAVAVAQGTPPTEPGTPSATPANPQPTTLPPQPQEEKLVYVKMTTSMGDIILELNEGKAPISVKNFLSYAEKGSYEGTVFHRVMPGFVVQGGGYTKDLTERPTDPPIKNEWENGLKNARGTIAMARKGAKRPNPEAVNSATSQFYFNLKDNTGLDEPQRDGGAYAVFGKVVSGMDVVDKIAAVKTESRPGPMGLTFETVPVEPVTITKVVKITADEAKAGPQNK